MLFRRNLSLFRRTHVLERDIDEFLDRLSESAIVFKDAVRVYLESGPRDELGEKQRHVSELESRADTLRRGIETELYTQTLIPDARGDVLGLLENLDAIHNQIEGNLWGFALERPDIPEALHEDFLVLTERATQAVEAVVLAARAFFRDIEAVRDHMHKVMLFETEADKVSTKLKRAIFDSDLELSRKLHIRHFVEAIDDLSDRAEDVADRLAIYTIKRTI